MHNLILTNMKKHLGTPLTAIILAVGVFILPKILYDDFILYKSVCASIKESLHKGSK